MIDRGNILRTNFKLVVLESITNDSNLEHFNALRQSTLQYGRCLILLIREEWRRIYMSSSDITEEKEDKRVPEVAGRRFCGE